MTEWIDDNCVKGEMDDETFKRKIDEEARTRDIKTYGRDGNFVVYEEIFQHRGLSYKVQILRYYQIGVPLNEIKGMNPLGKWATLEPSETTEDIRETIEKYKDLFLYDEFLWQDTLHSWNDNQTLKQMFELMVDAGKRDIDWFLDEAKERFFYKIAEIGEIFKEEGGDNNLEL